MPGYYEFFSGGGMVRAALDSDWNCLFANDIDAKKCAAYSENWDGRELLVGDIANVSTADLPARPDLAWASFPCQDLSLAGAGAGLSGSRSGTFWSFWRLVRALDEEDRAPRIVVLENVCGILSSHGGADFAAIGDALSEGGYRFGAIVIDAVRFVPQSRPRLFIVAVKDGGAEYCQLSASRPNALWHPSHLTGAYEKLTQRARNAWVWWTLPVPTPPRAVLSDLIDEIPEGIGWHSLAETERLLSMMSLINRQKVDRAAKLGRRVVGSIYRRTRIDEKGNRVQRAEVRFDGISGCLRTPLGGSSRQTILIVDGENICSRLLSPREASRLMGLPESYILPRSYNDAYHLAGDGVVVAVVKFLSDSLLLPILSTRSRQSRQAA